MNSNIKPKLLIAAGILIIGIIALFAMTGSSNKPSATTGTDFTNTSDTPSSSPAAQYIGFDDMITKGLSNDQLNAVKFAIYNYASKNNIPYKQITVSSIVHLHDRYADTLTDTLTFQLAFDSQTPTPAAVMYSTGVSPVRLYLYDTSSTKIQYDSGDVDITQNQDSGVISGDSGD